MTIHSSLDLPEQWLIEKEIQHTRDIFRLLGKTVIIGNRKWSGNQVATSIYVQYGFIRQSPCHKQWGKGTDIIPALKRYVLDVVYASPPFMVQFSKEYGRKAGCHI